MQWTGLNDLREKYLSFFESKNHTRMASASLIPQGDKSLLLINSGMAPLKKFFLGQATPPNVRVTTCQKCIRTPDIESVGKTARHGTYFEMLGNFSFGDYFKPEAIAWAWEFLTKTLEIPADRLWITIYESDDEAEQIWENNIGIPHDRIIRLGKKDNFWEHGSGPCGPCSEIHFDRGEAYGPFENFEQASDCDRVIEIWNLVFSQFDSDGNGHYEEMKSKNIDTGMGLERLACVMQGVDNIFEVDTVQNIMKHISSIAGVEYKKDAKTDVSLRVITDHIRSTTLMVGDGIQPSNSGRGYVLRRLLRRAARHGRLLGITRPFLSEVCDTVIKENEGAYPELAEKKDYIKKIISVEEEAFAKTIDKGTELLNQFTEKLASEGKKVLSGDDAFKLADTYGFPIDLTEEICEEKGFTVDRDRFTELAKEQRARAKADHAAKAGSSWADNSIKVDAPKTVFTGYTDNSAEAEILAIYKDGAEVDSASEGEDVVIVLDRTPFYAESGGQVGDTGTITCGPNVVSVDDTIKSEGHFLHIASVTEGTVTKGEKVTAEIDVTRRNSIMRNHTSAHLLQNALRKVLGDHVHQAGQLVNEKACRFDFNHFSAMTDEEIAEVERLVNNEILSAIPVTMEEMPIEEAKKLGAMALFGEKYGDVVRVVTAGDSIEFCGGTHVSNSAQIGLFKIVSESSVAAGVRRIEAVTGSGVLELLNSFKDTIIRSAKALKLANITELPEKCASVASELKDKEKQLESLNQQVANSKVAAIFDNAKEVNGVKVISARMDGSAPDALRKLGDSVKDKAEAIIALFAAVNGEKGTFYCVCTKDAIAKGGNAGQIVREVSAVTGGKGGGKPDGAMAGAGDITKVDEALAKFEDIVSGIIK
ncbi:alanine--tRNA ligase [Ruminococcus sp. XPD3002]|uniref:alanine--tRNA ligase n=1 Tax=Ruminococcus sp. XPD3002 TaxID=1452269 RepID=UPI0009205828|nr:alanyl-tRNA synthetase [Ruminococcus flavefaciens]